MRSKTLRKRGESFIQAPEAANSRRITFGKCLYIVVLSAIILITLQWGYHRLFFVDGIGFLEAEATLLEARSPGRIVAINCQIDDQIAAGVPLVVLGNVLPARVPARNKISNSRHYLTGERKFLDIENRIKLLEKQVSHARDRVDDFRAQRDRARELFRLDAITRPEFDQVEQNLNRAEYELTIFQIKLDNEIRLLEAYEQQVYLTASNGKVKLRAVSSSSYESTLHAQDDGIVSAIYKRKGEIAKLGEPILKVVNPKRTFVKTYFKGAFENSIEEGDDAKLEFENGETAHGTIRKIYPTAFTQPPEFKNRFGSVRRYIIAEIVPNEPIARTRILETRVKVLVHKKWF